MVRRVRQIAILMVLTALLILPGLSRLGQIRTAAAQAGDTACTDGYVLWSNSASAFSVLDWSGSNTHVQGKVRSNWAIRISGSSNVIDDTVEYVSSFVDAGDDNQYPAPVQVGAAEMPVSFDIDDYSPGGSAAIAAEQAGRYHYISGDLEVGDDDELRDGLYYITGDVEIDADDLNAQVTIVARGNIEISSAGHELSPYSGGLLLFSGAMRSWDDIVKISGGDSGFQGIVYAPGGQVEVSGSENLFRGGLFARTLKLNGSALTLIAEDSYCQPAPNLTSTATATSISPPTSEPTAASTSTPTSEPTAASTSPPTSEPTATSISTPTSEPTATSTSTPTVGPTPTSTSTPIPPATATLGATPTPPATPTTAPTPTVTRTPTPGPGPVTGPIFLPLAGIHRNSQTGEPNNLCGQAYYISPGVTYAFLAEDAQDWYTFELASPGNVTVELRNFVPWHGQIAAYRGENCPSTTFLQNNGDSTPDKTLALGSQPAGRYFLFVGNDGLLNGANPYTLTIVVR